MAGPFLTDISKSWDPDLFAKLAARYPMRRGGDPSEIVGAALYLASDASSFTTGSVLRVDGGQAVASAMARGHPISPRTGRTPGPGSLRASHGSNPARSYAIAPWGIGEHDVSVFHDLTFEEEARLLEEAMTWQHAKFDAGYGAISWPEEFGGAGLPAEYERAFTDEERRFTTPPRVERWVTVRLIAPTPCVSSAAPSNERNSYAGSRKAPRSCAASCSQSQAPARTWRAWPPRACTTGTSGWSTGRRCGAQVHGSRRGES